MQKRNTVAFWDKVEHLAERSSIRLSKHRRELLRALAKQSRPQTADQLLAGHRVTTYRNLERLIEAGLVKRVRFENDDADRYELSDQLSHHHHHVVCESCGKTAAIEGCHSWFKRLRVPGFDEVRHQLEFYGRCRNCRQKGVA